MNPFHRMRRRSRGRAVGLSTAAAFLTIVAAAAANAPGVAKTACDVPAGEPAPGTTKFAQRDLQNQICAGQKVYADQLTPSYALKADSEIPADYASERTAALGAATDRVPDLHGPQSLRFSRGLFS